MTSTYMITFYHFLNGIFFKKLQWNLFKYSNKSNRFQLTMESDEETAAAIAALLLVKKKKKKREKGPCG